MTEFDLIECGYNLADETINFGTRHLADGDNLYEASTLATLRCSDQNDEPVNPHVNAVVLNGRIYFNVDSLMRIFKDKECSDVLHTARFDAIVDSFCLSLGGSFLLICLRNGKIHLLDCNNDYENVFSASCERDSDSDYFFINCFFHNGGFLIVTKMGQIYRVLLEGEYKLECVHEFRFRAEIACFQYPFLLVNGVKLAVLDLENNNTVFDTCWKFKKIFPLTHMFLGLDFDGNLFRICAITLLIFPVNNSILYKDMHVLSDSHENQIIAIMEKDDQQNYMQLLSYSGNLNTIYSLKVASEVVLMSLDSINDEVLYISKVRKEHSVSELRFHVVYETEPEQRLHRLLRKRNYEEAERFAALFKLDIELIHKAKAQDIVDKTILNSEDVDKLICFLNIIEDDEFKLQSCLDVYCHKIDDVRKILDYGCKLKIKKQQRKMIDGDLQKSVIDLKFRFDTFVIINRGIEQDRQVWFQFAACDLIVEVKSLLRNYKIEEAKIIYSRLDKLTAENLTEEHISDILAILNNLPLKAYQPFLATFVQITLSICPSTLPLFVKWMHSKVFYLEKHAKADFPNNAIKFAENIVSLMAVSDVSDISFQRQCVLHHDSLVELSSLLSTLKSLKILKDEYKISIPVSGYLSGPENVIRLLLNIEMCPHDYDIFLKHFLCKYIVENHMELNDILLKEIKDLMNYEERYWVNIIGSILNCISSVRVKLIAVKIILDSATIPWSDSVRKIANDSLQHPLTSEIKELIEKEPMQVVLMKPKYKIREKRIENANDLKFAIKRIIFCNEPTMVEDVYQLCKNPGYRYLGNMFLIEHFIRIGDFNKVLSLLDKNSEEEITRCAEELAVIVETAVNSEMGLPEDLIKNYYEMAGSIFERLKDKTNSRITLDLIRNVYDLNRHFSTKLTTHFLRSSFNKYKILNEILEDVRHQYETGKQNLKSTLTICTKLAASLSLNPNEVLMKFCEKTGDYNIIFKTAQRVFETEDSSKNLCLMSVLLLKYVDTTNEKQLKILNDSSLSDSETSSLLCESEMMDDEIFCKGLELAQKTVEKAVYRARSEDILACLEVARWVKVAFYFNKNENNDLTNVIFGDIFDSASILPGFGTFSAISNAFNTFSNFTGIANSVGSIYLAHFKSNTLSQDDFIRETRNSLKILDTLSKEGQPFTSFKILETLERSLLQLPQPNVAILSFLQEALRKRYIPTLLSSILSNNVIDLDLLCNLLISCERDESMKFIVNSLRLYKRKPRKFSFIARAGLRLWEYHELTDGREIMTNVLITIKWWKKFQHKNLNYDNFFKISSADRFQLLVNSHCLDMKLAKQYCEDYHLDPEPSYKYFLKTVLQIWQPDYEVREDSNGRRLIVKNDENDLLNKCYEILPAINEQQVLCIISKVWSSINTYYYEVFIAMLLLTSQIDSKKDNSNQLSMLMFLKNYQRVSKPSETEIEQWYTNFPDTQTLDPLSEFRLSFTPFLFTNRIFSIIRPEINLKTYRLWFSTIEMLKPYLSKNEICSYVVKDVVASGVLSKDAHEGWALNGKHDDLLREIDECVTHISDLELSTSLVYHLMTHTAFGADQVKAAKLCYKYAVEYRKRNPESAGVEKAVTKVEKKYFTYCAMHILHTYKLTEQKYLNLSTQPNQLILALYQDERILGKNEIDLQCPDINKATEALAELFGLDIQRIRQNLINNWLGDQSSNDLDFDSSIIFSRGSGGDDSYLKRIAYVCRADNITYWQDQLFQKGLGQESEEQKSAHCRASALKVFVMISDADTILKNTDLTFDEFMNFIDKLTVISNLQYLGISLDVEALDKYNKKELLSRLVQKASNVLAVETMALICMTYALYDAKYWEFILNSTIKFGLFTEVKVYVGYLKNVKYQYNPCYVNAWQKLIDNSFAQLNGSQQLDQILLNNFRNIQSCPVLFSLNFDNAFKRCMERGKAEFAAVLLQYMSGEKRSEYLKEIKKINEDFGPKLDNLDYNGLWGIPVVREILADL